MTKDLEKSLVNFLDSMTRLVVTVQPLVEAAVFEELANPKYQEKEPPTKKPAGPPDDDGVPF